MIKYKEKGLSSSFTIPMLGGVSSPSPAAPAQWI